MKLQILNQFQTFEKELGDYTVLKRNDIIKEIKNAEGGPYSVHEWENDREVYIIPKNLGRSGKLYKIIK